MGGDHVKRNDTDSRVYVLLCVYVCDRERAIEEFL